MSKILVIRLSAIGDVAMTVPVVQSFAVKYPQHQITVLSRPRMSSLFAGLPSNVSFMGIDLQNEYKGVAGLFKLCRMLEKEGFDCIADLHDVLRTKFIRGYFTMKGHKCAHIDKGRREKKALVREENKEFRQLKSSFQRYADVFGRLGMPVETSFNSIYGEEKGDISAFADLTGEKGSDKWIGIAPFATHTGKIYPPEKMEKVVELLSGRGNVKIFLFGGGKKEVDILSAWEAKYPGTVCVAGKLKMDSELALMSRLDVMVSMDSGNMHLASLTATPVVSIWGATHPYAGFMGWKQKESNAVQLELPCRPCSVYGNKPCHRGDYACLQIAPETITEKILNAIS